MLTRLAYLRISVLADMLRLRAISIVLLVVAALQLAASQFLHLGFPCAFHDYAHIPCPGCGITRSLLALLHGHPADSLLLHPFGPFIALSLLFLLVASLLPRSPRYRLAAAVETFETRTWFLPAMFVLFLLVWVLRLTHLIHLTPI